MPNGNDFVEICLFWFVFFWAKGHAVFFTEYSCILKTYVLMRMKLQFAFPSHQ